MGHEDEASGSNLPDIGTLYFSNMGHHGGASGPNLLDMDPFYFPNIGMRGGASGSNRVIWTILLSKRGPSYWGQ